MLPAYVKVHYPILKPGPTHVQPLLYQEFRCIQVLLTARNGCDKCFHAPIIGLGTLERMVQTWRLTMSWWLQELCNYVNLQAASMPAHCRRVSLPPTKLQAPGRHRTTISSCGMRAVRNPGSLARPHKSPASRTNVNLLPLPNR